MVGARDEAGESASRERIVACATKEFLEKGKITREEYEDRKDGSMR